MIEEVPQSSWAAIKIPAKHGNLVFDFSEIADKFELALSSPSDQHCTVQNIKVETSPEEVEVYVDVNLFPSFKFGYDAEEGVGKVDHAFTAAHSYGAILFDSGCSTHMTPLNNELRNQREIPT